jgi:hypothetical protein
MFLKVIRLEIMIILQSCPLKGLEHWGGTLDIIPYGHKFFYEDKLGWGRGM